MNTTDEIVEDVIAITEETDKWMLDQLLGTYGANWVLDRVDVYNTRVKNIVAGLPKIEV